jgi:hypothetical protein
MSERDHSTTAASNEWDDDADYELEPPDAEVLAAEERRGKEAIQSTLASIDIDAIYHEAGRDRGGEILEQWTRDFKFRFQVKHLLIATAVLAILLTLAKLGVLGTALVILVMLSVAGLYLYLQWQEKKHRDELDRRVRAMYERRRAQLEKPTGPRSTNDAQQPEVQPAAVAPLPSEADLVWQQSMERQKFRFKFSMFELLGAMTVAAVIFGLIQILGGPQNAATLLGFVALLGLVIHALGFEPPGVVVLGWWLILVMYVLLSIVAVILHGFA